MAGGGGRRGCPGRGASHGAPGTCRAGRPRLIHLETHGFAYENEALAARATFVALSAIGGDRAAPGSRRDAHRG